MNRAEDTFKDFFFVTVGSTDFDELIRRMDLLLKEMNIQGILQIGNGKYKPKYRPYFRYRDTLEPFYRKASVVVAHGGLATTMEVLKLGKPLISVTNPDRYDNHQIDIIARLSEDDLLIWCKNFAGLRIAIERSKFRRLKKYRKPACNIHKIICRFIEEAK
jgi:UDP-N-acetylglucosamine transferase subunit ALG13